MPPPLHAAGALGVSYRPVADDDLPFLAAVYGSTRAEEVASTGWPEDMQRQFIAQQFDAQHRYYMQTYLEAEWLVIEQGGAGIGRLYVDIWSEEIRLIDISLLPEARGRGIGGAILSDLMVSAREQSKALTIHVEQNNPAMRLYTRLGFEKVAEHGIYHLMKWWPEALRPS